jgi:hypothetical protein
MTAPRCRPTPITVAAVLLIVAGADGILAGGIAAALTIGFPLSPFVEVWLIAGGVFLVPAFVGGRFIRAGTRLLSARLLSPSFTSSFLVVVGAVLTVASGMLTLCGIGAVIAFNTPTINAAMTVGGASFALFNSVAVLYAGATLGTHLEQCVAWQRAIADSS